MKNKAKNIIILLGIIFLFISLTACSSLKNNDNELVIYSSSLVDSRADWIKEKAKEEGFDLELVKVSHEEMPNRLAAEKNKPIVDIVFGLNTLEFQNLKEEKFLEKYKPSWVEEISEEMKDSEGYYHSLVKQAILLTYNSELYNEENAPKDWLDLWQSPQFYSKYYIFPTLNGRITKTIISSILVRYKDENGELGISQDGWDAIKNYYNNGYIAKEGEKFYDLFEDDKIAFGPMWTINIAKSAEYDKLNIGYAKSDIGAPYLLEHIGIVKNTDNFDKAKEFVDWFGSAEIQSEFSKEFFTLPTNKKAIEKSSKYIRNINKSVKPQNIDWKFVNDNIEQWIEKLELEIMP